MQYPHRLTFSVLAVMAALYGSTARAADTQDVQFDTGLLKSRGLDTGLGQYFAESARYTPGIHTVDVQVNGKSVGRLSPRFGPDGSLCVSESFLQAAGLVVPRRVAALAREAEDGTGEDGSADGGAAAQCYDYRQDYPTAVITPEPGREGLSLVVPQEALDNQAGDTVAKNVRTGGTAALLNYQAFTTRSEFDEDSSDYSQAMLEEGLNIHDWLVRSRQSLTSDDGEFSSDTLYTYAQRTIVPWKKDLQLGQINTTGSLLTGTSMTGVQLTPDDALSADTGSGVQVTGLARGAQARVDIRQQGRVVYSTLVPAGPFTLTDIPVTSTNSDLDVTVTETDGSSSHFVVPAAALSGNRLSSPQGLSLAAGRYRDEGDGGGEEPWLATVSDGWHLAPWLNAGAGVMVAERYTAVAGSVDTLPFQDVTLSGTVKVSDDPDGNHQGQSTTLSASYTPVKNIGLNASATLYSKGYRDLQDTLDDDFSQYSGQYAGSISWSHPVLGAFSLGYTLSEGADGSPDSRYVNASWGRTFGKASVSVTWQTQVGNTDECGDDNGSQDHSYASRGHHRCDSENGDMFFVNVSIPFGQQSVSLYSRTRDDETTAGAQTSGDITDNSHYTVSAERDYSDNEYNFNGTLNSNLHYTQVGLSAGTEGTDRNYGAALSGGVVAHSGGVTFSPWPVKDTFAIVDAGRGVSGAEISTPSGPVWTDYRGQAVIPSVSAYRNTRIEMDTTSLPDDVDVDNGFARLAAGRGSVSRLWFHVARVARVMMHVTLADGSLLKKGASVVDNQGDYIATAVEDGLLFLSDASARPTLWLMNEHGQHQCQIYYSLPEESLKNVAYAQINGECR